MSDYFISQERASSDLLDCAAYIAERIKSSDGHAEAMSAIIPHYLSRGEVDLAAELANAIDDPFARDKMLVAVAEKCAELEDDEYALQLADAVEDHGIQAQAFERIGSTMAAQGRTDKAAEVAATMGHPDFVYAAIAVKQRAAGASDASDTTLSSIEFPAARVAALQQIAAGQMTADKASEAIDTLARAIAAADEIEHNEEKIRVLCEIGSFFIDLKRNDRAVEIFDRARGHAEMLDNMHRDAFLVRCAIGFLHAGSLDLCDRTLDLVTDKTHMSSALVAIARDHWQKDEKEDALDALDEAYQILKSQRDIETRSSRDRNALMTTIAAQFAGFGNAERATAIAFENQDPNEVTSALSQIAQILAVQGEETRARQTIDSIAEDADRVSALIGVADTKEKQEEKEAAMALLSDAHSLTQNVPQLTSRSFALGELAARFADHGDLEKARQLSLENLSVIAEIRDESNRASALAAISSIYKNKELVLAADETAALARLTG